MMRSILQDWVMALGLRHQGVLISAVRGCDSVPKEDASKALVRVLRGMILNAHCGDPAKAATFIEVCPPHVIYERMNAVRRNCDHYPHHYLMHLVHAAEIVGYKHPHELYRGLWSEFYFRLCRGLHVTPETEAELDARLNADEAAFAAEAERTNGEVRVLKVGDVVDIPGGGQGVVMPAQERPGDPDDPLLVPVYIRMRGALHAIESHCKGRWPEKYKCVERMATYGLRGGVEPEMPG